MESRPGATYRSLGFPRLRGFDARPPEGGTPNHVLFAFQQSSNPPNDLALQKPGDDQSGREKPGEGDKSKDRYVLMADVKQRLLEKRYVHVLV